MKSVKKNTDNRALYSELEGESKGETREVFKMKMHLRNLV